MLHFDIRVPKSLDAFLQEFGLSNKEGIALMCLAESLLRVPDEETADRLIAEKISSGDHNDIFFQDECRLKGFLKTIGYGQPAVAAVSS